MTCCRSQVWAGPLRSCLATLWKGSLLSLLPCLNALRSAYAIHKVIHAILLLCTLLCMECSFSSFQKPLAVRMRHCTPRLPALSQRYKTLASGDVAHQGHPNLYKRRSASLSILILRSGLHLFMCSCTRAKNGF